MWGIGLSVQFRLIVYCCFFSSGAAGLVYEVVWARQLGLFLGITAFAHTAVITAYMAGLALGSWYFGRRSDATNRPLQLYAWLEIGVGLYAAMTPWAFTALQSAYAGMAGTAGVVGTTGHLARISIALVALLVPTFLMGGTLPSLVRGVTDRLAQLGSTTSRLYGINTLGAMTGTLLTGYVLIPQLGITTTIFVGVTLNLAVAALVLTTMRGSTAPEQPAVIEAQSDSRDEAAARVTVLVGFGAAGFAALLTQLAWIRALILMVGGSVYAFTIALACFLAGIGIGSLVYDRLFRTSAELTATSRLPHAAVTAGLAGLTIIAGVPLLAKLPEWFLAGYSAGLGDHFAQFQLYIFGLAFVLMFLPTLLMGVMFPLVAVIWTRQFAGAARGVGTAYAVNTAGTILGSLLGGLLILAWLGIQNSLVFAAAVYVSVGIVFWVGGTRGSSVSSRVGFPLGSLLVFAVCAWSLPPWDRVIWGNGVFYRPEHAVQGMEDRSLHDVMARNQLLYYEEGMDGTVVVSSDADQKYLVINGKPDASSVGDLQTQLMVGHMPALFHDHPRNALIIGLGSGITAGAVAAHDSIQQMTVLEILPEVVEASKYFVEENQHVLGDPRVELVTADARNYVLSTDETWDIIISEPSNPWISGISNLFTDDFFKLAKERLAPGGIMTQWFHSYSMGIEDVRSVLRTFSQSFAYVTVWHLQAGDLVMVGSDSPHELSLQRFARAQVDDKVGYDLKRARILSPRDMARLHLLSGDQLKSYIDGALLNTDDHPRIEFNAPRNLYSKTTRDNMVAIAKHIDRRTTALPLTGLATATETGIDVHAMELDIVFPDRSRISDVLARWLVWREPLEVDGEDHVGLGSSRQLQWLDLGVMHTVQATELAEMPPPTVMDDLLSSHLTLEAVGRGDISLHGGHQGRWLLTTRPGEIEVGIVWACPNRAAAFTRFLAYVRLPDPGVEQRESELVRLASHYRCQDPP